MNNYISVEKLKNLHAPIYQDYAIIKPMVKRLTEHLNEGEKVIWRDAFRWHDKDGVLSNHFECMSIHLLCEDFNYELIHNFNHVAVIKPKD